MTDRVPESCTCELGEMGMVEILDRGCPIHDPKPPASSNRICVICGGPPEAHDGKIVQHAFGRVIPNRVPCFEGCQYGEDGICTQDVSCGRVQADATPNRVRAERVAESVYNRSPIRDKDSDRLLEWHEIGQLLRETLIEQAQVYIEVTRYV